MLSEALPRNSALKPLVSLAGIAFRGPLTLLAGEKVVHG